MLTPLKHWKLETENSARAENIKKYNLIGSIISISFGFLLSTSFSKIPERVSRNLVNLHLKILLLKLVFRGQAFELR